MGTEIHVKAGVTRLFPDLPNRSKDAIANAIMQQQLLVPAILSSAMTGGKFKLKKILRYARGSYYYGLPAISLSSASLRPNALHPHLFTDTRYPVDIWIPTETQWFDYVNLEITEYGNTTQHPSIPESTYLEAQAWRKLLEEMTHQDDIEALPDWENHTLDIDASATPPTALFTYDFTNATKSYTLESIDTRTSVWHYAKWNKIDSTRTGSGSPQYWFFYKEEENTIPDIHAPTDSGTPILSEVTPTIPIKANNAFIDDSTNIPLKKSVERMLKQFPINLEEITESIDENPDTGDVTDVHVHFGINLSIQEEWGIKALYESFKLIESFTATSGASGQVDVNTTHPMLPPFLKDYFNSLSNPVVTAGLYPATRWVHFKESTFNNTLLFRDIEFTSVTGVVELSNILTEEMIISNLAVPYTGGEDDNKAPSHMRAPIVTIRVPDPVNIGDTLQCRIVAPQSLHRIGDKTYEATLAEEGILIPLFASVLFDAPHRARDDIFFGSAHLTAYAVKRVHVSWYETFFFQSLMFVVGLYFSASAGAGLNFIANSSMNALVNIGIKALTHLMIEHATRFLIRELGDLGIILSIGLSMYVSGGMTFNGLADTMHAALSNVVRVIETYTSGEMQMYANRSVAMQDAYAAHAQEVDTANEYLNLGFGANIDAMAMTRRTMPNVNAGEAPEDFYRRTSSTLSMGDMSDSIVNDYFNSNLRLPSRDSYLGTNHNYNPNGGLI